MKQFIERIEVQSCEKRHEGVNRTLQRKQKEAPSLYVSKLLEPNISLTSAV